MATFISIVLATMIAVSQPLGLSKRDWDWEVNGIETKSLTPDVATVELEVVRLNRDEYVLNGVVDVKKDLTDDFFVEAKVYHSATGSNDYKKLPFHMPRLNLTRAVNDFYKPFVMESAKACAPKSPQFSGDFVSPLRAVRIVATNCRVSEDGFPITMPAGFYKVVVELSGQVEGHVLVFTKITKKLL